MSEGTHRNTVAGPASGAVLQAHTVRAGTIVLAPGADRGVLPVPRQFPPLSPVWTNREHELARLEELAARAGQTRVLITGLAGVGKTALGVRWLATRHAGKPGGELYADLDPGPGQQAVWPERVLAGWLRALGIAAADLPPDLAGLTALYRSVTADRPLLVLVDNAASAERVRPLIPASAASVIVVTSRHRLPGLLIDGFRPVDLGAFTPKAAVELLTTVLGPDAPRADPNDPDTREALEALARSCHGHPLALVIAGAHLASIPHRTPSDLLTDLDTHPAGVLALRVDEASLGGLLDMTYDDLPADHAAVYRVLAVHPGREATAEPVAAALQRPVAEVRDSLNRLHQAHLLTAVSEGRYQLPEQVRAHALAMAQRYDPPETRWAALRRTIEWYLLRTAAADRVINPSPPRFSPVYDDLDTSVFPTAATAEAWWAREGETVLACHQAAVDHGWDRLLIELTETLWNPLRSGAMFAEDLIRTQRLGVPAARRGEHVLEAVFLTRAAFGETLLGEHERAAATCTVAVGRARGFGDSWVLAAALSTRARAATAPGGRRGAGAAIVDLGEALTLDEQRGDTPSVALRHRRLGQAHASLDDVDTAVWHLGTAERMFGELGNVRAQARALTVLAEAHLKAGRPGAAMVALHRLEGTVAAYGSVRHRVDAHTVLGQAYAAIGKPVEADRCYREALDLLPDAGPATDTAHGELQKLRDQLADQLRARATPASPEGTGTTEGAGADPDPGSAGDPVTTGEATVDE